MAQDRRVSQASHGLSIPVSVAVFLTATSVLAFEVALTRAFSVLLRYHFVFLAISLATCGLGVGGLLDFLLCRRFPQWHTPTQLSIRGLATAVLYPLAVVLLFATPLSARLTSVWVVSAVCICPFLAAGLLLSRAFAEFSAQSGRLYFADLAGAAIGSFAVIAILQLVGAINAAFVCGLLAALGAAVIACGLKRWPLKAGSAAVLIMLGLLFIGNTSFRYLDLPALPLQDDPLAKPLYQELADPQANARIVASEWNAFARTDVVAYADGNGEFDPKGDLYVYTDGEVPTNMIAFDGDLSAIGDRLQAFIGFVPFEQFRPQRVMLIGPGGGLDVLLALASGSKEIVGAELNPSIPRIVRRYGEFTGHIYDYENVHIYVDEGRSFLSRSQMQFDMIYMALTKTATTASSSLALVESYIHTKEALTACLQHLTPEGKIAFVCQEPLILLRTMLTAREALAAVGVPYENTVDHFLAAGMPRRAYMLGPYRHLLIISRNALSPEDGERFAKHAIAAHFDPAYAPGAYVPLPFKWLTDNPMMDARQFVNWFNADRVAHGYVPINIIPCTDDRPFVVDMTFGVPAQFTGFMAEAFGLAVALSLVLLLTTTRGIRHRLKPGPLAGAIGYFMLLGIGFMLVETSLIQKLVLYLGYPVLSLSTLLFAVLISSAVGSLFTQRWPEDKLPKVVMAASAGVVVYGLSSQLLYPAVVGGTLALDIRWRCLITMVMLFPLGFCLGMPFPSGLRVVGNWGHNLVPWLWGINGLTSVVGSVAAMSLAKLWGFSHVQMVGWAFYAGVFVLATAQLFAQRPKHKWRDRPPAR